MKRTLLFAFFIILAASLIAVAIIYYSVHWILLVLLVCFLALFAAYIFLGMKLQELFEWLIWPRGVQSTDDRGISVELREIKKMPLENQITKQELNEGMKLANKSELAGWPLLLICWAPLLIFAYLTLYFLGVVIPSWINWIIFVVTVPLGFLSLRFFKVAVLKWQAGGLVVVNRCASCGYSLKELPPAEDGCTICPECGAAWKLQH